MQELSDSVARMTWAHELTCADVPLDAVCIVSSTKRDDRGALRVWDERTSKRSEKMIMVSEETPHTMIATVEGAERQIRLRNETDIQQLTNAAEVWVDVSVLPLRVWGPIVHALYRSKTCKKLRIIYAVPEEYSAHHAPTPTSTFDLSERVQGIEPVPGFAKLGEPAPWRDRLLVVVLGFEGTRARYVSSVLDPLPRVVPVVGVPGTQAEYPTCAVACNREFFEMTSSYSEVQVADACSPFAVRRLLERLSKGNKYLYLAPLGTKPHALGCLLFAMDHWDDAELIYDHPVAKAGGTTGVNGIYSYKLKP